MVRQTIRLVDDEPQIRTLVRSLLVRHGYHILEAGDGAEALAILDDNPARVDLLLTDIVMPGMDGIALADRVWARHPRTPVVYMSGKCEIDTVQRHVRERGFGFVRKPFQIDVLTRAITDALDARARRQPGTERRASSDRRTA